MPNIIIINRKWEESFDIPRWKAGPEYDSSEFEDTFCSKFKELYLSGDSLKFSRLDRGGEDFYVIKTYVDLNRLSVKKRTNFYHDFTQFFLERVIKKDPVLFLVHGQEGFKGKIPELCTSGSWYELFQGGGEPIYYKQGGILMDFDYHPKVLQEMNENEPFSLKAERLSYIWNYYYDRTKQKLLQLRERILLSQIPGYPESEKQLTKNVTANLLENLRVSAEDPLGYAEVPSNLNFSHGNDLQEIRTSAFSPSLVQELCEYIQTSKDFYPKLNEALEEMVSNFNK